MTVYARFLKHFHEELAPVIHDSICASILQCKYHMPFQRTLVNPVSKVSNPVDINNDFRQILVLPQVAKLLEMFQLDLNKHELTTNTCFFETDPPSQPLHALRELVQRQCSWLQNRRCTHSICRLLKNV